MINRVKISITGKNPDYFLKELIKRNINIYHLEKNYKNIIVIVDYSDYLKILDIKTSYKIKVLKKYGISKISDFIKTNKYLLIFIVIGILLNIFLSNIIFSIEIIHPNKKIIKIIERDLKELGISKYKFKVNYKKLDIIKNKILEKEKENIEWIEIENVGTKYIVKVEERIINKENNNCNPRNIIASKPSIILEIKSSNGEIVKKINDYVSKDEVIISGLIHNKENIVSKRCAKGIVYGEVWYKVKVSVPKELEMEEDTNNINYGLNIHIFNKKIDIHKKMKNFKRYNTGILDSYFLPLNINFTKYQEFKKIKKIYNLDNIDSYALKKSVNKIKEKLNDNEEILNKKVLKKTIKNSKIYIEVFFKVKEDITSYQDISNINIDELNTKEE